jgi:uncharacterized protein (TIGR02687 family)
MNIPQITEALQKIFHEDGARIVFWYDAAREFNDILQGLNLTDVNVIRLDSVGALELKIRLEMEDPAGKYLIYAPFPEPAEKDNWLLDIQLYSRPFNADMTSILLDELGLIHYALRGYLHERQAFFKNQDRVARIKKWVRPDDTETELDIKMLAVISRAESPDVFNILMKLLGELRRKEEGNLFESLKSWDDVENYGLADSFWQLMINTFGYAEPTPSLMDLLIRLIVTDFANDLKGDLPQALRHLLLLNKTLALNASVFLSQWRGNVGNYESYNNLTQRIASELKMDEHLSVFDEKELLDVMTFESVDRRIVRCLRDRLLDSGGIRLDELKEVISRRRDGHWANPHIKISSEKDGNDYLTIYNAIESAAEILELRKTYSGGFGYPDAGAMYAAYIRELFRFDQLYRLFHEAADMVELKGWDVLKEVHGVIETCYSSWFIDQLAVAWSDLLDRTDNNSLLRKWAIENIANQQNFFVRIVESVLKSSPQGKVFVIISDAFRYEAAEELAREINIKNRFKAVIESQLGVIPSYTLLGMAALLPHKIITFKQNENVDILVDDQPIASIDQRSKVLSNVQGIAIKAADLMAMNKEQGRKFVKPWRVIYIYHNQIDATGDAAVSEAKTFNAVRTAIKEIAALVSFIINSLNGSRVVVTADHGFLYQESSPAQADKCDLVVKPAGLLKGKKRYLLGNNLGDAANVWHGTPRITAGTDTDMEFWIPKGANRFYFAGGARYIHGGAMLQEIVLPVVTVKELHGQAAERAVVRKVEVSLLGSVRKIVNNIQRFDFIQTEAVGERILPRTLIVSLRDGEELISNEESLTFDSQSSSMDDRKKSAKMIIKAGQYDKKREYALVLRDAETKIEYLRVPLTIDLAFSNDF